MTNPFIGKNNNLIDLIKKKTLWEVTQQTPPWCLLGNAN